MQAFICPFFNSLHDIVLIKELGVLMGSRYIISLFMICSCSTFSICLPFVPLFDSFYLMGLMGAHVVCQDMAGVID